MDEIGATEVVCVESSAPLGVVVRQTSPERFCFEAWPAVTISLWPGDYVGIVRDGVPALAVVESVHGGRDDKAGGQIQYRYWCRIQATTREKFVGTPVCTADSASLARAFSVRSGSALKIGEMAGQPGHVSIGLPGEQLLGRHTCCFGVSGSGKSTLLGLLVEEILLRLGDADVVILDPNSDFRLFREPRDERSVNDGRNLCDIVAGEALERDQATLSATKMAFHRTPTVAVRRFAPRELLENFGQPNATDTELLLRFIYEQAARNNTKVTPQLCLNLIGRIPITHERGDEFDRTIDWVPRTGSRARGVSSLQNLFRRAIEGRLWAMGSDDSLESLEEAAGNRLVQFDFADLAFPERAVLAGAVLEAVWNRNTKGKRRQTFLVIDEAHNLAPSRAEEVWQRRTLDWINRIASEGRKYGMFLIVVSQRPAKIHTSTLDNCKNYFVFRIQNRDDISNLGRRCVDVSEQLLFRASGLLSHEGLAFGDMCRTVIFRTGRRRLQ